MNNKHITLFSWSRNRFDVRHTLLTAILMCGVSVGALTTCFDSWGVLLRVSTAIITVVLYVAIILWAYSTKNLIRRCEEWQAFAKTKRKEVENNNPKMSHIHSVLEEKLRSADQELAFFESTVLPQSFWKRLWMMMNSFEYAHNKHMWHQPS